MAVTLEVMLTDTVAQGQARGEEAEVTRVRRTLQEVVSLVGFQPKLGLQVPARTRSDRDPQRALRGPGAEAALVPGCPGSTCCPRKQHSRQGEGSPEPQASASSPVKLGAPRGV